MTFARSPVIPKMTKTSAGLGGSLRSALEGLIGWRTSSHRFERPLLELAVRDQERCGFRDLDPRAGKVAERLRDDRTIALTEPLQALVSGVKAAEGVDVLRDEERSRLVA